MGWPRLGLIRRLLPGGEEHRVVQNFAKRVPLLDHLGQIRSEFPFSDPLGGCDASGVGTMT